MTAMNTNRRSNSFLGDVLSSLENLDAISVEIPSDDKACEKLLEIHRKFINIIYPLGRKFTLASEYGVSHGYLLGDRIKTTNILLEFRLILNDCFARLFFRDLEDVSSTRDFFDVKSKLPKLGGNSQILFGKIKSAVSKLLNETSSTWNMRVYRILNHAHVNDVKLNNITAEEIKRCARQVIQADQEIPSERITPRYLDVLLAAKLILAKPSNEDYYQFSFDLIAFEQANATTRANTCKELIYSRSRDIFHLSKPNNDRFLEAKSDLWFILNRTSKQIFKQIKDGSSNESLVEEKFMPTLLARAFRILMWDQFISNKFIYELRSGDITMPNIVEISKKFLINASFTYQEEKVLTLYPNVLEAAVFFVKIAKDINRTSLKALNTINAIYYNMI